MTRYLVDTGGNYIGGFDGKGVVSPIGAIEVPTPPPTHATQKWTGNGWGPPVPQDRRLSVDALAELLVEKKLISAQDVEGKKK